MELYIIRVLKNAEYSFVWKYRLEKFHLRTVHLRSQFESKRSKQYSCHVTHNATQSTTAKNGYLDTDRGEQIVYVSYCFSFCPALKKNRKYCD